MMIHFSCGSLWAVSSYQHHQCCWLSVEFLYEHMGVSMLGVYLAVEGLCPGDHTYSAVG